MNPLAASARRLAHLVWRRRVRGSLERTDACSLFGLDLLIAPGVLHPGHFASSRLMGRHVMSRDVFGKVVADLGTGSGILALLAARSGAVVTAIDIDPAAAACAALNARRNKLEDRLTVAVSDVFDQVEPGRSFDLVITNPPFYPRAATSSADQAFAAGVGNRFFARLAETLPGRLAKGGALVMLQSSDADFEPIARMFERQGFAARVVERRRGLFETLAIREFR